MEARLRVLIIEDSEDDALLMVMALSRGGYKPVFKRVETAEEIRSALDEQIWDLILCDHNLPQLNGRTALGLVQQRGADIPFIIVSGTIGEEAAVAAMKAGAHDYIMKDNLSRLAPAVERELRESVVRGERRRAEDMALMARKDWENIFQAVGSPTLILDAKHRILAANRAVTRASGLSEEEILGKSCYEIFHGADINLPPQSCPMVRLLDSGTAETEPMEMEVFGGVFLVHCTPVFDEQGHLDKVIHIATDITVRVETERALLQEKLFSDAVLDSLPDIFYVLDEEGFFVRWNKNEERLTGYSAEELSKMKALDAIAEEDRGRVARGIEEALTKGYASVEARTFSKNGKKTPYYLTARSAVIGGKTYLLGMGMDMTERKRADDALRERDVRFNKLCSQVPGMIYQFMRRPDGSYCAPFTTEAIRDVFGCSPDDVREDFAPFARVILPEDLAQVIASIEYSAEHMSPWECEYRVSIPGQPVRWMFGQSTPEKLADGSILWHGFITDTTQRKRTEGALRESEEKYRRIAENVADVVWTADLNFRMTYVSPSVERMVREPLGVHVSRTMEEKFPPHSLRKLYSIMREEFEKEKDPRQDKMRSRLVEVEHYRADGTSFWIAMNISFIRDDKGNPVGFQGVSRDITERKRAEEQIRRNEARLEGLLRISQYRAQSTQDLLDYALEEAIRLTDSRVGYIYLYDDEKKEFHLNTWSKEVMKECSIKRPERVCLLERTGAWGEAVRQAKPIVVNDFQAAHSLKKGYPSGHVRLYKYLTVPVFSGGRIVAVAGVANKQTDYDDADVRQLTLLMDSVWRIMEQKRSQEAMLQAEGKYRSIFENAQEGIFQATGDGRYITANQAMATILGYGSPEELMVSVMDVERQLYADPEDRRRLLTMVEKEGSVAGYETRYTRKDGAIIWASVNERVVRDKDGHVLFYEGFVEDITSRKTSLEQIRKALGATVQAISVTVEARDPYTAGHQRRVADLARAMGVGMGLPAERVEGLHMAGLIHDLGKISVPAEILSKPSRLTEFEFALIKVHPQAGHDILKDIEFPWPIARMVLEHHERIDGSGYPNGRTGDSLLMESRILAVADVVESMASHRPYRPAIGLDEALREVSGQRAVLYDADAVDACLSLFEMGYSLAE